jgi:hypothetical protein
VKIPDWLPVYGDVDFRGDCPTETAEQIAFFNIIRRDYPDVGSTAVHPKNEAKRKGKDFYKLKIDKALGLTPGASDIIIPGLPSFVCEMKRKDHTKSKWQVDQLPYLETCKDNGAFVCVAFGHEAALEAFEKWMGLVKELQTHLKGKYPWNL